jgi:hypothetical protein
MAAPTTTGVPLGLMTVTVSKESTQSRVIILRSFLYTIARWSRKTDCEEQRCAYRNIGQALGELNE